MKIDKSSNTMLMFLAVLMVLITGFFAYEKAINNTVNTEFNTSFSLTGAKLSDKVYATVDKNSESYIGNTILTDYTFSVFNGGEENLTNWRVELAVPEGTSVANTLGIDYSADISDKILVFTPNYYVMTIPPGIVVDFDIVLKTTEPFDPDSLVFYGYLTHGMFEKTGVIFVILLIAWIVCFIGFLVTRFNLKNYKLKQKNDVKIILQSMNTFISFIDAKDPYTRGHSKRVAMYAAEIAKRMGLSEDEVQNIYYAGLLHDSGKISIPDAVLNKPGKLTDEERKLIQNHTVAGGKMLKQLSSLRGVRETALYHHERFDGKGYPEGLIGEAIPLYARIVGVADSYDAMSSNRVYRRHLNKDDIIEEIQQGSGTQFDPDIVKYMVDMINDGYVNVVKMETAEKEDEKSDFHITENDIPGVYMGM